MNIRYLFLFLLFIGSTSISEAQVNIKIGYELDYINSAVNNSIVKDFNSYNSFLTKGKELKELHFMNGLVIGLSYKTKFSRTTVSWHTSSRSRNAFGEIPSVPPNSVSYFEKSMRYNISGFQVSSEFLFLRYAVGASLGNESFKVVSKIPSSSEDKIITNQKLYTATFHVGYRLYESNRISLHLKPYYRIYFNELNQKEIVDFLEMEVITDYKLIDNFQSFGLSVIFYNGKQ